MLRGFGLGELMNADDGQTPTAGASPADVGQVADETTQSAVVVDESAEPTDGINDESDEHDNEDTEPLSAAELEQEIAKLRRQSARRRIERNRARDEVATLRARVGELEQAATAAAAAAQPDPAKEANERAAVAELRALRSEVAGDLGVSVSVIKAAESVARASDESSLREALAALQGAIGAAAGRQAPDAANPTPPEQPSQPASLRDQIKQAEQEGTVAQRIALKTRMLAKP
jgi:hypothetical protein